MAYYGDCIACQHGQHGSHIEVPGPVPEGMIGGWICPCTGDCAERNPPPKSILAPPLTEKEKADWAEFEALMERVADV